MDWTVASSSSVSINFNPALFLQRQELLLQTLRQFKPKSVLDIGCGEANLLACLCNCDDLLRVEILAGLDISLDSLQNASSSIRYAAESQQEDGRWRSLDVTLVQGSFIDLASDGNGKLHFEAIISSEVIEHLDPPDLSRYWEIHLGAMKPDILIVTTPNRDFNTVFETVEKLSNTTGQSYRREGVPYRMRHDDHRFEYTRLEFEEVCGKAAEEFDYAVSFTGVGTAYNALNQNISVLEQFPNLRSTGYCTQAAVFTACSGRIQLNQPTSTLSWGNIDTVLHAHYPRNIWTEYPPSSETIASSLGAMWRHFCPEYHARNTQSGFHASPVAKMLDGVYFEEESLVVCQVSIEKLWSFNYPLGKLCRFNKDIFMEIGEKILNKTYDRGCIQGVNRLTVEFVGLEFGRGSLQSFRLKYVDGEIFIMYEYSKDPPKTFKLDRYR